MKWLVKAMRQRFWESLLPQFDTASGVMPLKPRRTKKPIGEAIDQSLKFNTNSLKFERENETTLIDVREWESVDIRTTREKQLTKSDIEVLTSRKLPVDKARVVKTFWAEKKSRKIIAFELKQRGFGRGYHESLIGSICAALAYANGEGE